MELVFLRGNTSMRRCCDRLHGDASEHESSILYGPGCFGRLDVLHSICRRERARVLDEQAKAQRALLHRKEQIVQVL